MPITMGRNITSTSGSVRVAASQARRMTRPQAPPGTTCSLSHASGPMVMAMFLPIVIGINNLYPWAHAALVNADPLLKHKAPYLNVPFFLGRAAFYFAGWMFLAWWFNRWSLKEDLEGYAAVHGKMSRMAGPGLLFWGFSVTFMVVDWVLSVDPMWFSTIFGMLFMVSQALTAMAFLITLMVLLYQQRPMSEVLTQRHLHDLGKFLLALVMVWAYFSFSQFLIIWAGNLPRSEEHTSELQSPCNLVCRLLLEKKNKQHIQRLGTPIKPRTFHSARQVPWQ